MLRSVDCQFVFNIMLFLYLECNRFDVYKFIKFEVWYLSTFILCLVG